MEILSILDEPVSDDSIVKQSLLTFNPYSNTSMGYNDEIRIPLLLENSISLPSSSYLLIEGSLKTLTPDTVTEVALIKNFLAFLFSEARIELNGQEIDSIKNPGFACLMKNYLSFTAEEKNQASAYGWIDEGITIAKNGTFQFIYPLNLLFGLFQDYKRCFIFSKLELVLVRARNDSNCVVYTPTAAAVTAGTAPAVVGIELSKLQWKVPYIEVNDVYKLQLLRILEAGKRIPVAFRSWDYYETPSMQINTSHVWTIKTSSFVEKPLYVIAAFQTARRGNTTKNNTFFDHVGLQDAKLYLNSDSYPYSNLQLSFANNKYVEAYKMFCDFKQSYYGDSKEMKQIVSWADFKSQAPLIVFDCSKQQSNVKLSSIDVKIEFQFSAQPAADTIISCLIIHDRVIKYNPFSNIVEKIV